jgi:uncharacterized protein YuzE
MSGKAFEVRVDEEANAAYISMSEMAVYTSRQLSDDVIVDVDEFGMAVGVELLTLDAQIPLQTLTDQFHVRSADIELLRLLSPSITSTLRQGSDGTTAGTRAGQLVYQ